MTEENLISKLTYEEAKTIAYKYLEENYEDRLNELVLENTTEGNHLSDSYRFFFERYKDNIPVFKNYIYFYVDSTTGDVVDLFEKWDNDLHFPKITTIKDKDEIREKFIDNTNFILSYDICAKDNLYLTYSWDYKMRTNSINAITGELIPPEDSYICKNINPSKNLKDFYINEAKKNIKNEPLNYEELKNLHKDIVLHIVGESANLDMQYVPNTQYNMLNKVHYNNFGFTYNNFYDGSLSISSYGELEYLRFDEELKRFNGDKKYLGNDYFSKTAFDILVKYMPSKLLELDLNGEILEYDHEHVFHSPYVDEPETCTHRIKEIKFLRIINGLPCLRDTISFKFSAHNGNIVDIDARFGQYGTIEEPTNIVSTEYAKSKFLPYFKIHLKYRAYSNTLNNMATLIYYFDSVSYCAHLSAKTGEFIDNEGNTLSSKQSFLSKVKNSKYSKEILALFEEDHIDMNTFDLNKDATLLDFIDMAIYYRDIYVNRHENCDEEAEQLLLKSDIDASHPSYYKVLSALCQDKIPSIENGVKFLEPLSRQDFSRYITHFAGHYKLAQNTEYFTLPFEDANKISKENIGCAAICAMIGAIEGKDDYWYPNDNLTMEELARAVYGGLGMV